MHFETSNTNRGRIFTNVLLCVLLLSCQKEIKFQFDHASSGFLPKDVSSICWPVAVEGNFVQGKKLTDSNSMQVMVHVTKPGNYIIRTDTVNGYSFGSVGNFSASGSFSVALKANGTPITSGNDVFTIKYDTSICTTTVTVRSSLLQTASFTLQGAPNVCTNAVVEGSFVKDIILDTSAKVNINVQVITIGSYSITTNSINGYSFSGTGIFTTTGIHTVQLTATGKPINASTDTFTVTAGSSSCTFPVTVLTALTVTNNDHFPLTHDSYWHYYYLRAPGDTIKRNIYDSVMINAQRYKIMSEVDMFATQPLHFRKTGMDYFEYGPVDKYTISFHYGPVVLADIPFLKENISTGTSWDSPEYTGTATFGQVIVLQYRFMCIDANATVTVNGVAFTDVYKIRMLPFIKSVGNQYGSTNEMYEFHYAKGVGLIYTKKLLSSFPQYELLIKRWQVN